MPGKGVVNGDRANPDSLESAKAILKNSDINHKSELFAG
jgi:hypothetical protein